jgi:hypothetical protein
LDRLQVFLVLLVKCLDLAKEWLLQVAFLVDLHQPCSTWELLPLAQIAPLPIPSVVLRDRTQEKKQGRCI